MTGLRLFLVLLVSVCFFCCVKKNQIRIDSLNFSTAFDKFKPGYTDKTEIEKILGKPSKAWKPDTGSGEVWEYYAKGNRKISFYFEQNSNSVGSITWNISDGEPDQKLKVAKGHFQSANWLARVPDVVSDSIPDECNFTDKNIGVGIEYRRTRKEVSNIWWWDANRKLANNSGECLTPECRRARSWDKICKNID